MLIRGLLQSIIIVTLITCTVSALMAAPQIQFDNQMLDLGKVVSGQIKAVFSFKNVGDAELEITGIRTGCGCTQAKATNSRIAPGGTSAIEETYNAEDYNGLISKSIFIATNDPTHKTIMLSIKAEIVSVAKLKPERLNFGSISVNSTRTHTLMVIPGDPKTFAISKVESQGSHVSVSSFRKVTDKECDFWELEVAIKAGSTPGRVMEAIRIVTNAGRSVRLSELVYGNIVQ